MSMDEAERAINSAPVVREHVRRVFRNEVDMDVWSPSGQEPIYDWEDVEVPGILSEETELALVRAGRSELLAGRAAYYDQESPGGGCFWLVGVVGRGIPVGGPTRHWPVRCRVRQVDFECAKKRRPLWPACGLFPRSKSRGGSHWH